MMCDVSCYKNYKTNQIQILLQLRSNELKKQMHQ